MNFKTISYLLGKLLCIIAISMLIPAFVCYRYNEPFQLFVFFKSIIVTLCVGILLMFMNRKSKNDLIRTRDGFLLVTLTWLCISMFGALPFYWSGYFNGFIDAFFESVSGFTTTGASVLTDIEALPYGLLFWRSLTQWIGGLGIVVLAVAILPQLSVGGMQLIKNEMPGPTFEQLKPRIRQTAISLWKIYVFFSVVLLAILYSTGMPVFDSFCHVFSTLSTGGFSTQNNSIAGYSTEVQMVMSFFMFLGACNFTLHYAWLHGDFKALFRNEEWRFFCIFLLVAILAISADLMFRIHISIFEALRLTIFQVASMASSTGFVTTDFNLWPALSKGIIFLLMFVGACAGSTGGGFKQIRLQLLLMKADSTLVKQIFPQAITHVKIGKKVVPNDVLDGVSNLFLVSVVIFAGCTLVPLAYNIDFVTSTTAVVSCLSNMGPGLELVGPATNYGWMPGPVKVMLGMCMIIGRLEFFTVLVLFLPIAWRK